MSENRASPKSPSFPDDWTQDHGDRLFQEGYVTEVPRPRIGVILGLLLLCLIPRLWAGTLHDIICPDAVSYLRCADALESDDLVEAFGYTGLNIYQPLLLLLKWLPGDWLAAAKWWSVAVATLAVLPIYGWLRRQFNETLAVLGCGFYALHPAMIHDSPLIVRDPTFWFLFALGLYVAWRAVSELRYRWFLAFAIVFGLMIHLRTEGWLLAPVLLVWVAFRLRHCWQRRVGIALAALLSLTAGPVSGSLSHEAILGQAEGQVQGARRHLRGVTNLTENEAVQISTIVEGTVRVVVRYAKAFGYLHLAFASAGLLAWKFRLFYPSKGALFLFGGLSFGAVWILCVFGDMDRRYAFPSVIISLPTISAGLCLVATWCASVANQANRLRRTAFSFWLLCLLSVSGIVLSGMIVTSRRPLLYDQAEIGRWILAKVGPNRRIAANIRRIRLVEYYGECQAPAEGLSAISESDSDPVWFAGGEPLPSVILIWLDWRNPAGRTAFEDDIRKATRFGYREVSADELPKTCRKIVVMVRRQDDGSYQRPLPSRGTSQNDPTSELIHQLCW